ncbi:CPBP family intramembrane glutamic endopeptidase [Rhodanobacter hydrolyticus]|uniref:CPBP family intramembrane metalloprotease n=1 Tax=Rhodanobacter hydrolyticus TaxID=2250595 RepID=A0ABW8J6G4_9GAMM
MYVEIRPGCETWRARTSVPRHCHAGAYADVVLSGGFEESGSSGRFRVRAGEVLIHDRFHAHLNRFEMNGAGVIVVLLFALAHMASFWTQPWPLALGQQLYAIALGVLYAYWLEKSGSIVAPIIGHNVSDVTEYLITLAWLGVFWLSSWDAKRLIVPREVGSRSEAHGSSAWVACTAHFLREAQTL